MTDRLPSRPSSYGLHSRPPSAAAEICDECGGDVLGDALGTRSHAPIGWEKYLVASHICAKESTEKSYCSPARTPAPLPGRTPARPPAHSPARPPVRHQPNGLASRQRASLADAQMPNDGGVTSRRIAYRTAMDCNNSFTTYRKCMTHFE